MVNKFPKVSLRIIQELEEYFLSDLFDVLASFVWLTNQIFLTFLQAFSGWSKLACFISLKHCADNILVRYKEIESNVERQIKKP